MHVRFSGILVDFRGIFAKIPAEWVADSAEWVAGSAIELGIFADFWRGAGRPRQKSKKMIKRFGRNFLRKCGRSFRQNSAKL